MTKLSLALIIIFLGSLFFSEAASAGTTLQLTPLEIKTKVGQRFTLTAKAIPDTGKNYTVRLSIKFLPELVSVQTWKYTDDWMPIRKSGYDELDNTTGVFVRTAGFPEGFGSATTFGTLTFLAKKASESFIQIRPESVVLDENNSTVVVLGPPVKVIIAEAAPQPAAPPVPEPTITPVPEPTTPPTMNEIELFDISLSIESALLNKSSDLVARTEFTSFGTVPTPVSMVYRIEDASGREVYNETDEATVETEQLVTKGFEKLDIGNGKYTLVLTTTYGDNVEDQFRQSFEVKGVMVREKGTAVWYWIISILIVVGAGGYIIYRFIKRKKKKLE